MTQLQVQDALKVGKWAVQCETVDGRAWQYTGLRFNTDDPRISKLLQKLREPDATIDLRYWKPVRALGVI